MKSHVWHAGMHPKMPIQIYFIKFLGHPILKFYGTAMILDDIMIILAPRCDISKIFLYKFCSEMSVNFKLCHVYIIMINSNYKNCNTKNMFKESALVS